MTPEIKKLPIREVVGGAYSSVFSALSTFVRVAAVPFILTWLAAFAIGFIAGWYGNADQIADPYSATNIYIWLCRSFPIVLFAVSWHRLALLGPEKARPSIGLDITLREFKFYAYAMILSIIMWVPYIVGSGHFIYGSQFIFDFGDYISIALLWWPAFAVILFSRFAMVLPATAIERRVSFGQSWKMTKGMTWRLVAIVLLCGLPFVILQRIIVPVTLERIGLLGQVVAELVVLGIVYLQVGVGTAALSLCYLRILQTQQANTDPST